MLILASTTDKLRLVTAAAGDIDVHSSWLDNVAGAVQPGRTNIAGITTATTTDIVGSPAAGVFRNIKTVHIRNTGTTVNTVTVLHSDGTTSVELHKAVLAPGETLQYIDEVGFIHVPVSGQTGSSRVLLKSYSTATNEIIVGPEVYSHTDIDFFEFVWVLRPSAAVSDVLVYLHSHDNGATYPSGPGAYGFAVSYANTGAGGGNTGGLSNSGYLGSPVGNTGPNTWAIGNARLNQPWKTSTNHQMSGQSTGYDPTVGTICYNFTSYSGIINSITNTKFYWGGGLGTFNPESFLKVYGLR